MVIGATVLFFCPRQQSCKLHHPGGVQMVLMDRGSTSRATKEERGKECMSGGAGFTGLLK
jgi:hypothetical protein